MKNLKMLLVAFAITMSANLYAGSARLINPDSVSVEIARLLDESVCTSQEEIKVTVFFSVSEDQKIQSLSVASPNAEISAYVQKKLENQFVPGDYWLKGKIYELTVVKKVDA